MEEVEIIILIPTIWESRFDKKYYSVEIVNKALSDFAYALANIDTKSILKPKISSNLISKIPKDLRPICKENGISENRKTVSFRLNCLVEYASVYQDIISGGDKDYDAMKVAKEFVKRRLSEQLVQKINELYILSQLSQPGAVNLSDGIILADNEFLTEYESFGGFIRDAYSNSMEKNYPKIEFISLESLKSKLKQNSITFSSNPLNKLEKALNCFTHSIKPRLDIVEIMMYSIIGLETLYVTGEANIQKQLNEKVQLFLGELNEHKKLIKGLYNSRSKLFHGEYFLQPYHFYDDDELYDHSSKIEDELFEAFSYSTMILIATLQKMISTDRKELKFEHILVN